MNKFINISLSLAVLAMAGACSKDEPFNKDEEMGMVRKSALTPGLSNPEGVPAIYAHTRAAAPTADDFTIDFTPVGETQPYVSYVYRDMPEVVSLPVGDYVASAHYGENPSQAWEAPYFKGETSFSIVADKITEVEEPIVAKLSNVRVSIKFDSLLKSRMSSDAVVTVNVGESGSLDFTANDADRSGYFAYVENSSTLTATFSGLVDGYQVSETKAYDNVVPGSHYSITFRLHDAGEEDPGSISTNVTVDAFVEVSDMNITLDPEEDEILEDDMRPVEGEPEGPQPPVDPDKKTPVAASLSPDPNGEFSDRTQLLDFNAVNEVTDKLYCAWKVVSEAEGGFQKFDVQIISDTLTPEELESVDLTDNLNLIDPGQYEEALSGLGFPVRIGGQSEAEFNITGFLTLMAALGEANHEFRLTVTDANGTSVITIKLHTN